MDMGDVLNLMQDTIIITTKLCAPMLIISMVIGLIISIFQAATQIHEQTITFVPKLIVIALLLVMMGSWMMEVLMDFTEHIFALMAAG